MRLPNDLDGVVMCGASVSNQRGLSDVPSLVASVDLDEGSVPVEAVADGPHEAKLIARFGAFPDDIPEDAEH